MAKEWPYVYQLGGFWWCDTGTKLGKKMRKRKRYGAESEAQEQARKWRKEYAQGGSTGFMTDTQRLDAINAIRHLQAKHITDSLLDAVTFYAEAKYPSGGDIPVSDAIDAFKTAKDNDPEISQIYRYSFNRYEPLRKLCGSKKLLSDVRKEELMKFIYAQTQWSDETKRQHFRYWRMFFDWCIENRHLAVNPLTNVKSPKGKAGPAGILPTNDVQTLVQAAWKQIHASQHKDDDRRFFLYLVFGFFCGIRPHECHRLKWKHVSVDNIRCDETVSKTKDIRNVALPLNAQAMLRAYHQAKDPKAVVLNHDPEELVLGGYFYSFKAKFRRFRLACGVKHWPHDAIRHSFASYFVLASNDMGQLQNRMGHSTPQTTLKHYVKLVHGDWLNYWAIAHDPVTTASLLQLLDGVTDPREQVKKLLVL